MHSGNNESKGILTEAQSTSIERFQYKLLLITSFLVIVLKTSILS